VPVNVAEVPCTNDALFAGLTMAAVGARLMTTLIVFQLLPFGSVTVSLTAYVPGAAYVWVGVLPLPLDASAKFQLYDGELHDDVELRASKLQAVATQFDVKFGTGAAGAWMNPVYSRRFGVPLGTPVTSPDVALPTSAARTCAGVAMG